MSAKRKKTSLTGRFWPYTDAAVYAVPHRYITAIITEKGVATAPYEKSIPKLFEADNS